MGSSFSKFVGAAAGAIVGAVAGGVVGVVAGAAVGGAAAGAIHDGIAEGRPVHGAFSGALVGLGVGPGAICGVAASTFFDWALTKDEQSKHFRTSLLIKMSKIVEKHYLTGQDFRKRFFVTIFYRGWRLANLL